MLSFSVFESAIWIHPSYILLIRNGLPPFPKFNFEFCPDKCRSLCSCWNALDLFSSFSCDTTNRATGPRFLGSYSKGLQRCKRSSKAVLAVWISDETLAAVSDAFSVTFGGVWLFGVVFCVETFSVYEVFWIFSSKFCLTTKKVPLPTSFDEDQIHNRLSNHHKSALICTDSPTVPQSFLWNNEGQKVLQLILRR